MNAGYPLEQRAPADILSCGCTYLFFSVHFSDGGLRIHSQKELFRNRLNGAKSYRP